MTPLTGFEASESASGRTDDSTVNAVTAMTTPATQPARNPMLVDLAFGDSSMRIAAMIGIGLIATPNASGRMSPMTPPMPTPVGAIPLVGPAGPGSSVRQGPWPGITPWG